MTSSYTLERVAASPLFRHSFQQESEPAPDLCSELTHPVGTKIDIVQKCANSKSATFHQARDERHWIFALEWSTVVWLGLRRCMETSYEACTSAMATLTLILMALEEE